MDYPTISVVVPCYNRPEPLKYTLRSVARAAAEYPGSVELVMVDDGSEPPIVDQLGGFDFGLRPVVLRQKNQGLITAKQSGLAKATGKYVLFLDSDDLIHPSKLRLQVKAMEEAGADVSYADMATAELGAGHQVAAYSPASRLRAESNPAEFYIKVQPAPHNPVYRTAYLGSALATPLLPISRSMDSSGEIWMYLNLCIYPARIVKVDASLTAPGPHEHARLSNHWEKLGCASLIMMETFMERCPQTESTALARQCVGEMAFHTWRGLPRGFNRDFEDRMLRIWKGAPKGPLSRIGAPGFARLARYFGPLPVAWVIKALRAKPYSSVRTLDAEGYAKLFGKA